MVAEHAPCGATVVSGNKHLKWNAGMTRNKFKMALKNNDYSTTLNNQFPGDVSVLAPGQDFRKRLLGGSSISLRRLPMRISPGEVTAASYG